MLPRHVVDGRYFVETPLEEREEVVSLHTRHGAGLSHIASELRFADAIVKADLLLLFESPPKIGDLAALARRLAMLAGRIRALLGILSCETRQLNAEPPHDLEARLTNWHSDAP